MNSAKVDCTGVGPMQCYQVKETEDGPWNLFYFDIEGFEFEPGFIYRIQVQVDSLLPEELAADKSLLEFKLLAVLSKEMDPVMELNDIWKLTELNGNPVVDDQRTGELPTLEINTRTLTVIGYDGCNNFRGKIESLSMNKLLFGPLATTRKMCPDMTIPAELGPTLASVSMYIKDGVELQLFDSTNKLVCRFKKID
ncbi:DUF4377 domain-containing protein [Aureitalea marina]|uniref:DUF4377 domain-containing protein n=1 Tax=Aureitalea marina TaxID=930804 RepID=UPI0015E3CA05|nr:DUF4377 domain-containing protein [Aureitalea marina]